MLGGPLLCSKTINSGKELLLQHWMWLFSDIITPQNVLVLLYQSDYIFKHVLKNVIISIHLMLWKLFYTSYHLCYSSYKPHSQCSPSFYITIFSPHTAHTARIILNYISCRRNEVVPATSQTYECVKVLTYRMETHRSVCTHWQLYCSRWAAPRPPPARYGGDGYCENQSVSEPTCGTWQ